MQLHSSSRFSLAPLAAALALMGAPAARAQTEPGAGTLGEVTVSGERQGSFGSSTVQVGTFRDQNPLDVPLTSNVITREVLDAQGQRTLYGALRNTAGVTRSQLSGSTYDNVAIRGILVENRGNYRLNGSLPIINLVDVPLENKERVEVLKGASSLYYGFVPPSGIVNYVTKRAGARPVTSIATSLNQYGAVDVHADIARRFGTDDALGLRINAAAGREDIGINNFSGQRELLSAALDVKVSSSVKLKFDAEYYKKDSSEQAGITLPAAVNGVITLPRTPDNKTNLAGEWQRYVADATNLLARADVALNDNWLATFELGQARNTRDRRFSQFALANRVTGAGTLTVSQQDGQSYENNNVRTELAGRVATGAIAHELSFGYTGNERAQDSRNSPTLAFAQNLYNPVTIPYTARTAANANAPSKITDKGIYVFDRIVLSDQWQVMAGVRRSDYQSETTTTRYAAEKTSPSVSVMFKPTPRTSVYASYIEGIEESGTAPASRANAGEVLPPSVNEQVELGVKAEVAQGLLLQAAYFDVKRQYTTTDVARNLFVVGGQARYKGLEFAASGEINRQWAVVASALLMDPKIVKTTVANELGKAPENAPKVTYSVFGEYRLPTIPGLALNAGWYYTGKRPVNNANQAYIDGVGLLSLGARYRTRLFGTNATLQANIDNLADKSYWSTAGNGLLGVGAPRTLRIAARFDF
ncbi:MAG: TonB-dependent receptor [Polaromonas sp.]|uniref:TonB-dependent siderophore receptor n=1 Tax=Polaromonas sp. TaxID=1869339 RepID=UPI00273416FD|nr:TonB-dependent receptor [Polaromonas sp.]MDP3796243.1 TonB-dependent receptor [Polaromonas sp.]